MSWVRFGAGAVRRVRSSASSPFSVKVMQSIGQMSTQASHSMQSGAAKTVCDIAVEAALRLGEAELLVEAELDLDLDVGERHLLVAQRHLVAQVVRDVVVVAPLVDAHLLADER